MGRFALFPLSLLFPVLTLAAGSSDSARSVSSIRQAPERWNHGSRAPSDTEIKLRLTLPSADISALHDTLAAVSTPGNARYGQHLSKEDAAALVAPTKETSAAVSAWLAANSLTDQVKISAGGNVIRVATTVGVAEKLLAPAEYHLFESAADPNRKTLRTLSWGVPKELQGQVESVHPTTLFPPPVPRANARQGDATNSSKRATPPASCANNFTPDCARTLYNLGNYSFTGGAKNAIGIYAEGASSNKADLKKYLQKYNPSHANTTWTVASVDGGTNTNPPSVYDVEATLDLDIMIGLTAPLPTTLITVPYSEEYDDEPGQFMDAVDWALDQDTVPTVLSFSYGMDERQIYDNATAGAVANQLCDSFAQLGVRGSSALVASGDSGTDDGNCNHTIFSPDFPASCPYVTAVGGTTKIPETTEAFSGGGFSNQFARPAWQNDAVNAYLKYLGSTNDGLYNKSGRAYPDVAAFSTNWAIYDGGFTTASGTSASCPNVAAIIAALNDVQIAAGKKPLGFLNPWIYGTASTGWQDITTGSNAYCIKGFNAHAGWDPATGWGSPDFTKLRALLP